MKSFHNQISVDNHKKDLGYHFHHQLIIYYDYYYYDFEYNDYYD